MNTTALYRVWTGPTMVRAVADTLTERGLDVEIEGTEHVFVRGTGNDIAWALRCPVGSIDWQRFITKVGK